MSLGRVFISTKHFLFTSRKTGIDPHVILTTLAFVYVPWVKPVSFRSFVLDLLLYIFKIPLFLPTKPCSLLIVYCLFAFPPIKNTQLEYINLFMSMPQMKIFKPLLPEHFYTPACCIGEDPWCKIPCGIQCVATVEREGHPNGHNH